MTAIAVRTVAFALIGASILLPGCGDEESSGGEAVEAREGNTVEVGGVDYRVTIFRQLNPRVPPDQALLDRGAGNGVAGDDPYFAAFLIACNTGSGVSTTTAQIKLANAFGTTYEPIPDDRTTSTAYQAVELDPDECTPPEGSLADDALPGAPVIFEVPVDDLSERPFVLEIQSPGESGGAARAQLDL